MFTIKPRAVSRVCRTALNCLSNCARSSAFSASACAFSLAARSRSAWLAARCASFSRFSRSASDCRGSARLVLGFRRSASLRQRLQPPHFRAQPIRFGHRASPRVVLDFQAIRFGCGSSQCERRYRASARSASARAAAACASFSRVRRSDSACALIRACSASRVTRSVSDCAATPFALRPRFALRRLLALRRQGLFFLTLDGDGSRVFRRLHRFPGGHGHRLLSRLARLVGFGLSQALLGLLKGLGGKAVRARRRARSERRCALRRVPAAVSDRASAPAGSPDADTGRAAAVRTWRRSPRSSPSCPRGPRFPSR